MAGKEKFTQWFIEPKDKNFNDRMAEYLSMRKGFCAESQLIKDKKGKEREVFEVQFWLLSYLIQNRSSLGFRKFNFYFRKNYGPLEIPPNFLLKPKKSKKLKAMEEKLISLDKG